jgi:hypothetical protein
VLARGLCTTTLSSASSDFLFVLLNSNLHFQINLSRREGSNHCSSLPEDSKL